MGDAEVEQFLLRMACEKGAQNDHHLVARPLRLQLGIAQAVVEDLPVGILGRRVDDTVLDHPVEQA